MVKQNKHNYPFWLEDEDYEKAKGQLKLQLNGVLEPFNFYGLGLYIPEAIKQIVELCEQFGKRVRGRDVPIKTKRGKK